MNREGFGKVLMLATLTGSALLFLFLVTQGFAPFWRTELGQRALNRYLQAKADVPVGTPMARVGQTLPMTTLPDLHGRRTTLPDDYRGQPLVISVWATWCRPCLRELPWLDALSHSPGGPRVVGVAWDEEADVRAFLARRPVRFDTLFAPRSADTLLRLGNAGGSLPYTVLLDGEGRLLKQRLGAFESAAHLSQWARADER